MTPHIVDVGRSIDVLHRDVVPSGDVLAGLGRWTFGRIEVLVASEAADRGSCVPRRLSHPSPRGIDDRPICIPHEAIQIAHD